LRKPLPERDSLSWRPISSGSGRHSRLSWLRLSVSAAEEVRQPLLYGKDAALVDAVSRVLGDADLAVCSVDEMLSGKQRTPTY
jgi:hypothetical protein